MARSAAGCTREQSRSRGRGYSRRERSALERAVPGPLHASRATLLAQAFVRALGDVLPARADLGPSRKFVLGRDPARTRRENPASARQGTGRRPVGAPRPPGARSYAATL